MRFSQPHSQSVPVHLKLFYQLIKMFISDICPYCTKATMAYKLPPPSTLISHKVKVSHMEKDCFWLQMEPDKVDRLTVCKEEESMRQGEVPQLEEGDNVVGWWDGDLYRGYWRGRYLSGLWTGVTGNVHDDRDHVLHCSPHPRGHPRHCSSCVRGQNLSGSAQPSPSLPQNLDS